MKKISVLTILGMLVIAGCYYDKEDELYPNSTNTLSDTASVSYANDIAPMMATNCTTPGCHAANGQSPNLTNYQSLFSSRSSVKDRAVNGTPSPMPSAGLMSQSNRDKLGKWIDAGAPNN